ncbi:MAG: hypothetical protein PUP92_17045 [Rhizonema sp. PD38]|nr:hypothetical protein [Rhizonema sp. PD38]
MPKYLKNSHDRATAPRHCITAESRHSLRSMCRSHGTPHGSPRHHGKPRQQSRQVRSPLRQHVFIR